MKKKRKGERIYVSFEPIFHGTKKPVLNLTKWKENPISGHHANMSDNMDLFFEKKP